MSIMLPQGNDYEWCDLRIHSLWSESSPDHYIGAVGQVIKPQHVTSELPLLDGLSEGENADGKEEQHLNILSRFLILFDW